MIFSFQISSNERTPMELTPNDVEFFHKINLNVYLYQIEGYGVDYINYI